MPVVRANGCGGDGWDSKFLRPGFYSAVVVSIIVVYPRMACQLIGARESFFASGESASEWLLPGVCTDVASLGRRLGSIRSDFVGNVKYLVFQPTEGSPAFWIRAFVGTGEDLVLRLGG